MKMWLLALGLCGIASVASAGPTMDKTKSAGTLRCGVSTGLAGFGAPDGKGGWKGLDVDVCRAVAAGVLGDATKVTFVPLTSSQRFPAIQSGEVDLLSRNSTHTLSRDTDLGLNFGPATFYDGQGFMVKSSLGVTSAKGLDGASVCVEPGSTAELNIQDYARKVGITLKPIVIDSQANIEQAFFTGRCDAYSTDKSSLAASRASKASDPGEYVILPETISKEPLSPAVRHGDDEWLDIVNWTVWLLFSAEEKGITSQNVDEMLKSTDPEIQRMLGVVPGMGKALHLDDKWGYNVIKQVGNYGEIFNRNVGPDTPLKLERGLNKLWSDGGLMYSPPFI
ncbi:amino acid ABC transporter substrate-binding protein [Rhizobium tropici]|uniref:Amino acid ABC transporter substrate-binding protein n=1 Tax=Rhizobium tropici TaxID=398 RepID=A0A5B0WB29_RHITR|nr:amino acid ABC transporter substrate-binding protein [Rhizobium tropici]KAA1183947.1 amino acid ABC transporter substrate-binding protein [Rhizobium tropici]